MTFLVLMAMGRLPAQFALPAGLGDMAMGITAPFMALAVSRGRMSRGRFVAWQVAGLTDLVVAIAIGVC